MIAAIYARKSTEQAGVADEQKSVTRQVDHARAYATQKGWAVALNVIHCAGARSLLRTSCGRTAASSDPGGGSALRRRGRKTGREHGMARCPAGAATHGGALVSRSVSE